MSKILLIVGLLVVISEFSIGQQNVDQSKSEVTEVSKEARQKMAEMHQQMADCLKSDKTYLECHKNMMANCPMTNEGSCPMMGSAMPMRYWQNRMHGRDGVGCCNNIQSSSQKDVKDSKKK